VISHSFAFSASRRLSALVRMLELSPPLPVLLLLRVGGPSRLNTRAILGFMKIHQFVEVFRGLTFNKELFPLLCFAIL
jgi:hypothetical protein